MSGKAQVYLDLSRTAAAMRACDELEAATPDDCSTEQLRALSAASMEAEEAFWRDLAAFSGAPGRKIPPSWCTLEFVRAAIAEATPITGIAVDVRGEEARRGKS